MNRPKVIVHGDVSVDGRLTLAPGVLLLHPQERWQAVSGPSQAYEWLKFTHQPQAYLEGSLSFISESDEPEPLPSFEGDPSILYQDFLPDRIVNRPGHKGWFTAVDSRGRIRWYYKEYPDEAWQGWHALVLVSRQTPPEYLAYLRREEIPYLVAGDGRVDLRLALEKMAARLGVSCVLSTSPGKMGGALLRAGLVDEISLDVFPAVIGGFATPSLFESPELGPEEMPVRLELISAQVLGTGRVWLRYKVVSQEEGPVPTWGNS